jgi:antitoxin HicB
MRFAVTLTPDDNDTLLVTVPDLPEAVTFGEDRNEALLRADGAGKAALARKLGVALPQIDRLLDRRHSSRFDAMERAFTALGRTLSIVVKDAA